jgi:hypothetical protein
METGAEPQPRMFDGEAASSKWALDSAVQIGRKR